MIRVKVADSILKKWKDDTKEPEAKMTYLHVLKVVKKRKIYAKDWQQERIQLDPVAIGARMFENVKNIWTNNRSHYESSEKL